MTDARFPERWLNDRRVVRLSDGAFRLYVTSLAWSASNRTDGYLDADDLGLIHGVDQSKVHELSAAGLWKQVTHGWFIVDFTATQTTKAQLEGLDHKRYQDRERKARQRARDKGTTEDVSRVTSGVTSDVTHRQGQDRTGQALTEPQVTSAASVSLPASSSVPPERSEAPGGQTDRTHRRPADDDDPDSPFLPSRRSA